MGRGRPAEDPSVAAGEILDGDEVLTSAEAAARLGMSVDQLHRRPIPYGAVSTHRRYLASNLDAWKREHPDG